MQPGKGIRRPLISTLLAAIIPVLLLAGWAGYRAADRERSAAQRAATDVVLSVANRVEAELSTQVQVAQALSLSAALDAPDLAAFYQEAKRLKEARPLWHTVELADASGQQILNLLRPLGTPLGRTADAESFEAVLTAQAPVVSGIGPVGTVSGRRLVAVRVPVIRNGTLKYVLTVGITPESISRILLESGTPPNWIGAVLDQKGNVIARTVGEQTSQAQPASPDALSAIGRAPSGAYRGRTLEGIEADFIYQTLRRLARWSVHLALPTEVLDGPVRRSLYLLGAGMAASLGLAVALASIVARDTAQRRREQELLAAAALEKSENRAAIAVEAADLGTWRWDFREGRVCGSERCRALLGLPPSTRIDDEWIWPEEEFLAAIRPEHRTLLRRAIEHPSDGELIEVDFQAAGREGEARWLRAAGRAVRVEDERTETHGVLIDVHERRMAEAERVALLRRLAEAHEEVQRRIARELHDQVGQTVTGLSMGLKSLERALIAKTGPEDEAPNQVRWLQGLASEIGREIHRVAADLRPTALDDLGLVKAVSAMTAEWSRRYGLNIDIQTISVDGRLPSEVETVAYRVVQESLTNVVKHAQAQNVGIVIERREGELRVIVDDDGNGFDSERPFQPDENSPARLGISGMRERVALVGGNLTVESSPGSGTTVYAVIPAPSGAS